MKLLITGANGQLAKALLHRKPLTSLLVEDFSADTKEQQILALSKEQLDIVAEPETYLNRLQPDVVINCAAFNAVDRAEREPEVAFATNAAAPKQLARWCMNNNCYFIHLSSDYVFADNPFGIALTEKIPANPQSVYGASKFAGEQAVISENPFATVIRTSWLYSACDKNFVSRMQRLLKEREQLEIVDDQVGSPTWAEALAEVIWQLVLFQQCSERNQKLVSGIFHYAGAGYCSWHEFACEIAKLSIEIGSSDLATIKPISSSMYAAAQPLAVATRPSFSALDSTKLHKLLPHTDAWLWANWREQLALCIQKGFNNPIFYF